MDGLVLKLLAWIPHMSENKNLKQAKGRMTETNESEKQCGYYIPLCNYTVCCSSPMVQLFFLVRVEIFSFRTLFYSQSQT